MPMPSLSLVSEVPDMVRGNTHSPVGFYGPQRREVRSLSQTLTQPLIEEFEYKGRRITNYEMESASACRRGQAHGPQVRMTVCSIIANRFNTGSNPNYKSASAT